MTPDWRTAGTRLLSWQRVLLLTHDRPDGDALGSLGAMRAVLNALGRATVACVYGAIPARYGFLEQQAPFSLLPRLPAHELDQQFDGILIMDTCSWSQLEPAGAFLSASRLPRIIVDHHSTRDDLTGASPEALYLINPAAASACTMLYEWCQAMNWPVPPDAAISLFTGMATDTGWFRFPSTDPRTLHAAADLLAQGPGPDIMYARLMDSYSLQRLRLLGVALSTLELREGGRIAIMHLTPEAFVHAGATGSDTEDIVNEPLRSREVIASALLIDQGDGKIRVNLRSKSPEVVGYEVDVAGIAARFGGGGHQRAAGARIQAPLNTALNEVAAAMSDVVRTSIGK
jgi:phosphoesterase RecJ-like protein